MLFLFAMIGSISPSNPNLFVCTRHWMVPPMAMLSKLH